MAYLSTCSTRSEFVTLFNQNRCDDMNSDTDFESEFEYDRKYIEFNQKFIDHF